MNYPFIEAIRSVLAFADEVVVLDSSDKDDGTLELLNNLQRDEPRVKVYHEDVDWTAPNHGIFDGHTKALARSKCTGTHCWQFDSDEMSVIPDGFNFGNMVAKLDEFSATHNSLILALPVVEFWGNAGKVRLDINLQKPRFSKNIAAITHGIPVQLRKVEDGLLYAKHGTDTCDYINTYTYVPCPVAGFVTVQVHQLQQVAKINPAAAQHLSGWYDHELKTIPHVLHYSWINIERKIKQYKLFWTSFWKAMYNESRDPKDNQFFPGKTWDEVSDLDIVWQAHLLETETGGWIFHQPWDGSTIGHMTLPEVHHPTYLKPWLDSLSSQNRS